MVDLEQFREAVWAIDDFVFHRERCGFPHQICDCGMKEARDRLLSIIDSAGKVESDAPFAEWLAKEMPAGTVIGDPSWWADRIARQYSKRTAQQPAAVVDEAMVDRYLAAQAKAVQEIDNKWGNGGKAPSYIHPVREACRAGLTAALSPRQPCSHA